MKTSCRTKNSRYRMNILYHFQFWPPGGATCIGCKLGQQLALLSYKFDHQVVPLALVPNLPRIGLLASAGIELLSSSASQLCQQKVCEWYTPGFRTGPIDWTPGIPGSDKNAMQYSNSLKNVNQSLNYYQSIEALCWPDQGHTNPSKNGRPYFPQTPGRSHLKT